MKPIEERVCHYIKPNETSRIPRQHIFLHAIPTTRATKDGQSRSWGVAVATFRKAPKGRRSVEHTQTFTQPRPLWDAVAEWCTKGARTVLWAHNLGYDIRLTDALHILPAAGWDLVAHNLAPRGTWMVWDRQGVRLTMVDLAAVFPKLLVEIGKLFGMAIPKTPGRSETVDHRMARCEAGERIVRTAATAYLDWLDSDDMGNWQMTGAGQSFATFRHKHLTHKLLVHEDRAALAMERRAMWTGRCEAFWHGELRRQVVHEWDFTRAYASVCATHPLPTKLVGPMPASYNWRRALRDDRVAMLAEVEISTDKPVVPTLHEGRILWPTGTFRTTLWDIELAAAIDAGAEVRVLGGYLYRTTPALKQWAEWILAALDAPDDQVPAWCKTILKHWSTALIGRFAMAYPAWEELAQAPKIGVDRRTCLDVDTGESYEIMQVGRVLFKQGDLTEWPHSMPAITGYVMAAMRVRLWRVIDALPAEAPLYVDTDSILVTDRWYRTMADIAAQPIGAGLRLKKSWDGFAIMGPRQIVTGTRVRVAGVPVAAERVGKTEFEGQVWESLAVAMSHHRADKIMVKDRRWKAQCVDRRRQGPAIGWTAPYRIEAT